MDTLKIRTEDPRDFPRVYDVNTEAFGRPDEAQLVDRLRSGDSFVNGLSLVATIDDKAVGHILLTTIDIVAGEIRNKSLALAPIAVLPAFQNKGIGSRLVKAGLNKAKELGYKSVIVLGHEGFYPKFKFAPANKWNIKAPFNVPENSFMALELQEDALEGIHGMVEYPKEFDEI